MPYSEINRLAWKDYATQIDFDDKVLNYYVNMPEYLVVGKSLVALPIDADVWSGAGSRPIAYVPPPGLRPPVHTGISLSLGGHGLSTGSFTRRTD